MAEGKEDRRKFNGRKAGTTKTKFKAHLLRKKTISVALKKNETDSKPNQWRNF